MDRNLSKVTNLYGAGMTWEEALKHGVDALIVSNRGGRAEESLFPTIDAPPEVVKAVNGKIPVLV